jgi:hypothetical protein
MLGVIAPSKEAIRNVVGRLIGGEGFLYTLDERRGFEGYFDLGIESRISPLQPALFARALHSIDRSLTYYVEGNLVAAL